MADNPALRRQQDRHRVAMHEDHEVRYWTHHLGMAPDQLQTTVDAVGHSTDAVRAFPAEGNSGTLPQQLGDAGTTRLGMEDGDKADVPATGLEPDRQRGS